MFRCTRFSPRFFFAADKDAQGGKAAPTVPELTAKVLKLEADLAIAGESATETGAALKVANETSTKLQTDLTAATLRADKAEADLVIANAAAAKLQTDLTAATQRADKADADLKIADTRAELKVRELYASNGLVLPAKQAGAGDHTVTQKPDNAALTPRQRLAAGFNAQG
jgi:hypothetical protein